MPWMPWRVVTWKSEVAKTTRGRTFGIGWGLGGEDRNSSGIETTLAGGVRGTGSAARGVGVVSGDGLHADKIPQRESPQASLARAVGPSAWIGADARGLLRKFMMSRLLSRLYRDEAVRVLFSHRVRRWMTTLVPNL